MGMQRMMLWVVVLVGGLSTMRVTVAQGSSSSVPSCAEALTPCADYLNSTKPPSSCCNPLKDTVQKQLPCLCNLFNSGLLQSFNINITQALQLSRRCGITSGIDSCKAGAKPPSSSSSVPPPPPATHGNSNGSGRDAFSGLSFLLLFWASMLFN